MYDLIAKEFKRNQLINQNMKYMDNATIPIYTKKKKSRLHGVCKT